MDEHTLNLRPPVWLPIVAVLLAGTMYIGGKFVETRDPTPTMISVSGEGKMMAVPDIASLSFGVQTGPLTTAKAAMAKLEKDMNEVLAAVTAMGIEEKDVSTQQLMLNPMYDWNDGKQTLRGYEATQSVLVKVRDLDKAGDVLSAVASKGANQIGGVTFTIDDPEKAREEARKKAIEQAEAKAAKLAADLGMRLGKLKGFSEGGGYAPPMPYATRNMGGGIAMDAMAEQASVPLPEGEQEVRVDVTLTYELK